MQKIENCMDGGKTVQDGDITGKTSDQTSGYVTITGWTCSICGQWVTEGTFHQCPGTIVIPPIGPITIPEPICLYCQFSGKCLNAIKPACFAEKL